MKTLNRYDHLPLPTRHFKPQTVTGIARMVLAAACRFGNTFTLEELTVSAWLANKDMLGLAGFTDLYPDNNRIGACVHGSRGLWGKGFLARDRKRYSVTQLGHCVLQQGKP